MLCWNVLVALFKLQCVKHRTSLRYGDNSKGGIRGDDTSRQFAGEIRRG